MEHVVPSSKTYENLLIKLFGVNITEEIKKILQECNALIAGGHVLSAYPPTFESSDMDFYVPLTSIDIFFEMMKNLGRKIPIDLEYKNGQPQYDESFLRQNKIFCRYTGAFKKHYSNSCSSFTPYYEHTILCKIDIMFCPNPIDVVHNFDLTCCQIWYNGKSVSATHFGQSVCQLNRIYHHAWENGNVFLKNRALKYISRGFQIELPNSCIRLNEKKKVNRLVIDFNKWFFYHFIDTTLSGKVLGLAIVEFPIQENEGFLDENKLVDDKEVFKFFNEMSVDNFVKLINKSVIQRPQSICNLFSYMSGTKINAYLCEKQRRTLEELIKNYNDRIKKFQEIIKNKGEKYNQAKAKIEKLITREGKEKAEINPEYTRLVTRVSDLNLIIHENTTNLKHNEHMRMLYKQKLDRIVEKYDSIYSYKISSTPSENKYRLCFFVLMCSMCKTYNFDDTEKEEDILWNPILDCGLTKFSLKLNKDLHIFNVISIDEQSIFELLKKSNMESEENDVIIFVNDTCTLGGFLTRAEFFRTVYDTDTWFYECKGQLFRNGDRSMENIRYNMVYVKFQLSSITVFVPIHEVYWLFASNARCFVLKKKKTIFHSVSYQALANNNYTSANHCQKDTLIDIYNLFEAEDIAENIYGGVKRVKKRNWLVQYKDGKRIFVRKSLLSHFR